MAYTNPEITHFVVVSSDRDYIPLYNKLHELGKSVITIPVDRGSVHRMIPEAADLVLFYESFFSNSAFAPVFAPSVRENQPEVVAATKPKAVAPPARLSLYEEYARALQQAIRAAQNDERSPVGAYLRNRLMQIRSDFAPAAVGFNNFKGFIQKVEEEGYIKVDWRDGKQDFIAELGENTSLLTVPIAQARTANSADPRKVARAVARFLEDKMKMYVPALDVRLKVLEAADIAYNDRIKSGPFTLEDWKELTLKELKAKGETVDQKVVFKLLLSLHYSRCLFCESPGDRANPVITGRRVAASDWESALIVTWINQIFRESDLHDADAETFEKVFYPDLPDAPERMQAIMAQVQAP